MRYHEPKIDPQLACLVGKNEKILWYGKPDIKCFVLEGIFNPLLPFALIWALVDGMFIFGMVSNAGQVTKSPELIGLALFFSIHLLPVWLYLLGVLTVFSRYRKTSYIISDYAVYVSGGIMAKKFFRKTFADLSPVNMHVGIIDRIIGVGDVVLHPREMATMYVNGRRTDDCSITDIKDYREVYAMINDLQSKPYNQYTVSYSTETSDSKEKFSPYNDNSSKDSQESKKEFSPYDDEFSNKKSPNKTSSDAYYYSDITRIK